MRTEMTFNDKAVTEHGYTREGVYKAITDAFEEKGLRCVRSDELLAFEGCGRECDYGYMWRIIINLLKADWFVECATSCIFIDDDDSEEDVLSQAWKARRRMA